MKRAIQALLLCTLALAPACRSSLPSGVPDSYRPDQVESAIVQAREDLGEGRNAHALARMRIAGRTRGLPHEQRAQIQELLEAAAEKRLEELDGPDASPKELKEMLDLELPRRIAVTAGIRAARIYFDRGERSKAFELLKRVDGAYPHHHERVAAGSLLAEIGFSFAADPGRYLLFFSYRDFGIQVLEYLVLNYPTEPRGDEAYWTLTWLYERDENFDVAIEKLQSLILWYPNSPYIPAAEARIPHLRLAALESPEYDRNGLLVARREIERWLLTHDDPELIEEVEFDLLDAIRRLSDSDLMIARFYREVDSLHGAEDHARRGLMEARAGGDPDQIAEAEALLEDILERAVAEAEQATP